MFKERNAATADKLFDRVVDEVVLSRQSTGYSLFSCGINIVQADRDFTVEVLGPLGVFAPAPVTTALGVRAAAGAAPVIVRGRWEQIKIKIDTVVSTTFVDDGDPETDETLPLAVLNVDDTTGFDETGTLRVTDADGNYSFVTYTGTTATSFTGCQGGIGLMTTGCLIEQCSRVAVRGDLSLSSYQA